MKIVKVHFTLDLEDGFPPIGVETLNARACDDGSFEIMNSPFFIKEIAYNDRVKAKENADGRLEFLECVVQSRFRAISIIFWSEVVRDRLISDFQGKDCVIEFGEFPGYQILAVAIPHSADYLAIKSALDSYEKNDELSYAELVC